MTNPAADGREGILFLYEFERFAGLSLSNQGHVSLDAYVGGTCGLARRGSSLIDCKGAGHCLGIEFEGGLAITQALIKEIWDINGAYLGTFAAGRTLFRINVAGSFHNLDLKVSGFTTHLLYLGHGQKFYIQMPPAFHQFG